MSNYKFQKFSILNNFWKLNSWVILKITQIIYPKSD